MMLWCWLINSTCKCNSKLDCLCLCSFSFSLSGQRPIILHNIGKVLLLYYQNASDRDRWWRKMINLPWSFRVLNQYSMKTLKVLSASIQLATFRWNFIFVNLCSSALDIINGLCSQYAVHRLSVGPNYARTPIIVARVGLLDSLLLSVPS